MNIDLNTIALILVISSVFQAIIIFVQFSKYPGIFHFGLGCTSFALGFLFVMLQEILSYAMITVVLGNSLLLLALILQYIGFVKFFDLSGNKWIPLALLALCFLLLIYFQFIYYSISYRIFTIYFCLGLVSFITAFTLFKNKLTSLTSQVHFLFLLFLGVGIFSISRAIFALYSLPVANALSSTTLQILSFTGTFILSFIITFTFIFMINKRLSDDIADAKEQFQQIFNLSPDASLITSLPDGKIVNFNLGFLNFSGYEREEVMNKSLLELNLYEKPSDRERLLEIISDNQSVNDFEVNFRHKNNSIRICTVSAKLIILNNALHIISIINDITDRKNAELAVKRSEEKYRFLTEFTSDVIWVFNYTQNKLTYISPSIRQLRGLSPGEAMTEKLPDSMTPESLVLVQNSTSKNIKSFIANPEAPNTYLIEIQQPCKNGDLIWIEVSTKYRYHKSGDIEIVGVSRNIDKRKRAEAEVLYLSYHDQLTGLYNRRFYEEELLRLDTPRNLPIALVMADVNGLKLINDAYGHQMGDKILKIFADILKNECRHDEITSRIGGDEFVILFSKTDQKNIESIISRLNETISKVRIDHTILSVSMGFAIKQDPLDDLNDVFKRAEDAMYQHKLSISPSVKKATIDLIINSIYEKNHQEVIHSKNVSEYCEAIGRELGFEKESINQIKLAGLRHDIGEIAIDNAILTKTEKLSEEEWAEIKRHPEIGYHILRSVNELAEIAKFVLEHHERWDGQGYPKGLKEEEITLQGRIIAVADAYCTMISNRPFCRAFTEAEAINELKKCSGTQFDESIAHLFVEKVLLKEWPKS